MNTHHHKKLVINDFSRDALQACLGNLKDKRMWWKDADMGFSIGQCDNKRIAGKYVWRETAQVETLDPISLEKVKKEVKRLLAVTFEMSFGKQYLRIDKKTHYDMLQDALQTIEGVQFGLDTYEINLKELVFEIQSTWKKNEIETVGIQDYLARENMLASANFKILEGQEAENIIEKFDDQLKQVKLKLKLPDGIVRLTVTKDGSISVNAGAPDEVLMLVRDLLPDFHEPAVETATVSKCAE